MNLVKITGLTLKQGERNRYKRRQQNVKKAHPENIILKSNKAGKTRRITVNVSEEWSAGGILKVQTK